MTTMDTRNKTYDLVYIGIFTVLIAVCSWISVPMAVPFTLQTFGVFLTVAILGGKRGFWAVFCYVLLGAVGLPVFSGFGAGIGVLLGTTGGYIVGFLASALVMWGMEKVIGRGTWAAAVQMIAGLIVCYAFGTAWFMAVYARNTGAVGLGTVLGWCVIPFIIPDLVKIGLALAVRKRVGKLLPSCVFEGGKL